MMLNENNLAKKILFVLASSLFFISIANADYTLGDDITVEGFDWNDVHRYGYFYYVDDQNNTVEECKTKCCEVTKNHDESHVRTTDDTLINHWHYKDDWGDGDMASSSEADAYWDARFQSPDICGYSGSPTNLHNCYSWACQEALDGVYNYWIASGGISTILNDDAQLITPQSNVQTCDLLYYGDHVTFVYSVTSGYPTVKIWKFNTSALYSVTDSSNFHTPMCTGSADVGEHIDNQDWTWEEDGAGCNGDVYRDD